MKKKHMVIFGGLVLWLITAIHMGNTRIIPEVGLSDETMDKLVIVKAGNRFLSGFDNEPGFDNELANTNLFSFDEQKLIKEIQSKLNEGSGISNKYRNANGDGYDLFLYDRKDSIGGEPNFRLYQIKGGTINGLVVKIGNGQCYDWKRYSNGMAVDKWLLWDKDGNLFRYIKFKEPYDFQRHTHWKFKVQISLPWPWNDKLLLTETWP